MSDDEKRQENIKLAVVIYFLIGFLLNLLGLIIGLLWIKFKAKTYRKNKLVALFVGFAIYVLYTFILTPFFIQPLIQPGIDQAFYKEYPDAGEVTQVIQQKYPDAKIFASINQNTVSTNGRTTTSTIFSVQHRSTKLLLTGKEMQDIAKQTCSILESHQTNYDKVKIISLKYTLPLNLAEIHWAVQKPCQEWQTKDFSNIKSPI